MSDTADPRRIELPSVIAHAAECYQDGRLEEAEHACLEYLASHPGHFDATHLAGVVKLARGEPAAAIPLLTAAVKLRPRSYEATLNLGVALQDTGDARGALAQSERALALITGFPEAHNVRGNALRALGRPREALEAYERALSLRMDYADALSNRAAALLDVGQAEEALASCSQALALRPELVEAHFIRGNALRELGRYHRALASYDETLRLQPGHGGALNNKIAILTLLDRNEEALAAARIAITRDPRHVDVLVNRGVAAHKLRYLDEALAAYDAALAVAPEHVAALRNRAAALRDLGKPAEALAAIEKLVAVKPDDADALYERAELLRLKGSHPEALAGFENALKAAPGHTFALGSAAFTALNLCEWDKAEHLGHIVERCVTDGLVVSPFIVLNLSSAPQLHQVAAGNFARTFKSETVAAPPAGQHDKINIAYVSSDFCNHATAHLIAELIERHDRSKFEVIGICFSPDDDSPIRVRLIDAFDQFHVVSSENDQTVAAFMRDIGTDIAVDLKGYTRGCRPGIFAARAAPVQVNWLGYPGTLGAPCIDYVIADPVVLPRNEQKLVTEQIVHLPDCYQSNDTKHVVAPDTPTREQAGLPPTGFVFCSFNNSFKITRPVFDAWMRLLGRVEGSVLWLLRTHDAVCDKLRREAQAHGIDPARLVFAKRMPHAEHLARHRLADLFLDTLPYNAHTTASDALWTGLPVVTCKGTAFPGRVGASLLTAIGLPDLVTPDLAAYEALAYRLATEPEALADCRRRLEQNRLTAPLFDVDRFRRHIEDAFTKMHELHRAGAPPLGFAVEAK
jgi:protein O-GlcNAc transferase